MDDALPVGDDAEWHALLMHESVTVLGPGCDRLAAAARRAAVVLVVGVNEREEHGGTVFNTVLTFGPDGELLGRHRKLIPTHAERLVWGMGDGSDLNVLDTPAGRLASLICWENYMPLARFHTYAQGPEVWLAPTLATADFWVASMRHIAREGCCFVLGVGPVIHPDWRQSRSATPPRCARTPRSSTDGCWRAIRSSWRRPASSSRVRSCASAGS